MNQLLLFYNIDIYQILVSPKPLKAYRYALKEFIVSSACLLNLQSMLMMRENCLAEICIASLALLS